METTPFTLTDQDMDVICHHIGSGILRSYSGLEAEHLQQMFDLALQGEADTYEFTQEDIEEAARNTGLDYSTHPKVRQAACERVAAAFKALVA